MLEFDHYNVTKQQRTDLYKLIIAHSDITEALFCTRLLIKTVTDMSHEGFMPLQDAVVISYGRAFKNNKPFGKIDKKWSVFGVKEYQKLHSQLIETRDTIVAHSDAKFRNVKIVPKGATTTYLTSPSPEITFQVTTNKFELDVFPTIENLCFDIGSRMNNEILETIQDYYGNMELPKYPFDLL